MNIDAFENYICDGQMSIEEWQHDFLNNNNNDGKLLYHDENKDVLSRRTYEHTKNQYFE